MNARKYDLIVVGGGFAGVAAAVAAARQKKNVLLIEKYNCLGGAAVFDLVNPFMPYWTRDEKTKERIDLSRGLFREIVDRMDEAGGLDPKHKTCFNEEILKIVLNRMVLESGVNLLFQTYVTGARVEDGRIRSLSVSNVSGNATLEADEYIDATGDANLAALCGCPFRLGREEDHLCQPMTLCFRLGNVRVGDKADLCARINERYREAQKEGRIKNPREDVLVFRTVSADVLHFNSTRIVKRNPTDAYDVTNAEIAAREQVFELYGFLRESFDEFKDSVLLSTGMQIGVRESRMIDGEYTLTREDLLNFAKFDDSIAVCNYDIDIHSPDGSGTSHYYFPAGKYYSIPYRCLLPKGVGNLLVAGRCISVSHEAQASIRIMPTCCTLGEAAGIAAAIASERKSDVNGIPVGELRERLRLNGAKID